MFKIFLVLAAGYGFTSFLNTHEIDVSSVYAQHPYVRCLEAHEGTPAAEQCKYLKTDQE